MQAEKTSSALNRRRLLVWIDKLTENSLWQNNINGSPDHPVKSCVLGHYIFFGSDSTQDDKKAR
jgi:hypothetical protein